MSRNLLCPEDIVGKGNRDSFMSKAQRYKITTRVANRSGYTEENGSVGWGTRLETMLVIR